VDALPARRPLFLEPTLQNKYPPVEQLFCFSSKPLGRTGRSWVVARNRATPTQASAARVHHVRLRIERAATKEHRLHFDFPTMMR
jgi:hypothetical protein